MPVDRPVDRAPLELGTRHRLQQLLVVGRQAREAADAVHRARTERLEQREDLGPDPVAQVRRVVVRRVEPVGEVGVIEQGAQLLAPLEKIAAARKATPAKIALAWLLAQGNDLVPIPGTKRRAFLEQNCAAADIRLSKDEVESLSRAFPLNVTAGTRYPEKQLGGLGI